MESAGINPWDRPDTVSVPHPKRSRFWSCGCHRSVACIKEAFFQSSEQGSVVGFLSLAPFGRTLGGGGIHRLTHAAQDCLKMGGGRGVRHAVQLHHSARHRRQPQAVRNERVRSDGCPPLDMPHRPVRSTARPHWKEAQTTTNCSRQHNLRHWHGVPLHCCVIFLLLTLALRSPSHCLILPSPLFSPASPR